MYSGMLRKRQFRNAYETAKTAGESSPHDQKVTERCLLTMGKAAYGMRRWELSARHFQELAKTFPENKEAKKELQRALTRLTESRSGQFDLSRLCEESDYGEDKDYEADVADYVAPLRIEKVPGKGEGLVAAKDIKKGTLLMVEKGFTSVSDAHQCVEEQLSLSLLKTPDAVKKRIAVAESRRCRHCSRNHPFHVLSSYISHSCLANAHKEVYGDVQVIHAVDDIKEGEEVTVTPPFFDPLQSYVVREKDCARMKFRCVCPLCEADRADPRTQKRHELVQESIGMYDSRDSLFDVITFTKVILFELRNTYEGHAGTPTLLYWPLQVLGGFLRKQGKYDESIQCFEEAIECLGAAMRHRWGIHLYLRVVRCFKQKKDTEKAREYAERAFELFHARSGLNRECFEKWDEFDYLR